MKAVLFLDVDGVLCTPLSYWVNRLLRIPLERQRFDPVTLFWLRRLVRRTGAVLVLCSSWRDALYIDDDWCRAIIQNLYGRLARNRTPFCDAAPILQHSDKSGEIAAWLAQHPCERYAVLDDEDLFAQDPQVRAHWVPIADHGGLRYDTFRRALRLLRGEEPGSAPQNPVEAPGA